ncbi:MULTISPECIES: YidB family protein [unclassified Bradyrhizobium]|uniref:YidB family protein n=1 Tax=unclassified Bradyrhizobium TaxID=2631580 RepID=UPI0028ED5878|nr:MULTISPECIES: YidB family protein [unclassified Bradyrhizobium]
MGLLDILNGMQNGPSGPSHPTTQKNGGMSPMTMAILALLAWKAVKHFSQNGQQPNAAPAPVPPPQPTGNQGGPLGGALGGGLSGGLGNIIAGGLGGLLAGGAAGSVLSGGLGDLLRQFQDKGHGDTANSWVSPGENKPISPGDLANALGADQIDQLTAQSGLSRDELLNGLSQYLPKVIDQLTPDGRLPTEHELAGRI